MHKEKYLQVQASFLQSEGFSGWSLSMPCHLEAQMQCRLVNTTIQSVIFWIK